MALVIPQLNSGRSVKDFVIESLIYDQHLTTKKLHSRLQHKYGISVTYQAVHKALNELLEQHVLRKKSKTYSINENWIIDLGKFVEQFKRGYMKNNEDLEINPDLIPPITSVKEGDSFTATLKNLAEADAFRFRIRQEIMQSTNSNIHCGVSKHMRSPLLYSIQWLQPQIENKLQRHFLIAEDTIPDKWCADFNRMRGAKVKIVPNIADTCDYTITGDIIVMRYLPRKVVNLIDKIYRNIKDITELNLQDFYKEVCLIQAEVKFVIMKNSTLAEKLTKEILSHFKEEKKNRKSNGHKINAIISSP